MKLRNVFRLSCWKRRIWYFFENIRIKIIIKQKYQDYWIIVPGTGLGENFIVASLMKEFKRINDGKIVFVIHDKRRIDFLSYFKDIDDFLILDKYFINRKNFHEYKHCKEKTKGNFWVVFEPDDELKKFSIRKLNAIDLHKSLLMLDTKTSLNKVEISKYIINGIKNKYNINSNTVLLCPHANTLDYLSVDFWSNLAKKLISSGYSIIINSNIADFKEFNCVFDSVLNTIAVAENCCCTISIRSGLIDILAGTLSKQKKIFTIYNEQKKNIKKSILEYNYFSLKQINNNICEYLFKNNEDKLIIDIINFIKL